MSHFSLIYNFNMHRSVTVLPATCQSCC